MSLERFRQIFFEQAPIFQSTFLKVQSEFGEIWESEFDAHLRNLFGDNDEAYRNAARGYSKFAIDAMRLQKLFNKKLKYEDVTYEEACARVYMDEDYMMNLYLPGIFVSHFLWRHHYRQFNFYKQKFLPFLGSIEDKRFYEIGTGTGFYTVQVFRHYPDYWGYGIDISPHSRAFTMNHLKGWGFEDSLIPMSFDITKMELEPLPMIQAIEVLEHLSDPQMFLRCLRKLLQPDGRGFITAALTAPNADHIYLYWTPDDVIEQLRAAGFNVLDYIEEIAYEGKPGEHVPKVAAFIIS